MERRSFVSKDPSGSFEIDDGHPLFPNDFRAK